MAISHWVFSSLDFPRSFMTKKSSGLQTPSVGWWNTWDFFCWFVWGWTPRRMKSQTSRKTMSQHDLGFKAVSVKEYFRVLLWFIDTFHSMSITRVAYRKASHIRLHIWLCNFSFPNIFQYVKCICIHTYIYIEISYDIILPLSLIDHKLKCVPE